MNRLFSLLSIQALGLVLLVTSISPQVNPATQQSSELDRVHSGDVVEVDVIGSFEFDWRGTLTSDGHLAGYDAYDAPILAICRRESEIAADISTALSKFLRSPKVEVRILDRSGRALARVDGAVRTPTRFMIRRAVHLRELLVMTGGIAEGADGSIRIIRRGDLGCTDVQPASEKDSKFSSGDSANGPVTVNITVAELLKGDKKADPEIRPGDFVTVSKAQPVYMVGGVNSLSPLYVRSDLTVSRAVAMAGGLVKNADASRISVYRREKGELKIIELDLGKIAKGDQKDEILRPFDILEVALKGGEKRRFPPASPFAASNIALSGLPLRIVE